MGEQRRSESARCPSQRAGRFAGISCWQFAWIALFALAHGGTTIDVGWAAKPQGATTSRRARKEAMRAIPVDALDEREREAVQYVLDHTSIYRRLPTHVIDCDPQLFTFLVRHPEVLVSVWRELGSSRVELDKGANGDYRADDRLGTTGFFRVLDEKFDQRAQNRFLVYSEGTYQGKFFANSPVTARCVLLLRSGSQIETNGRTYVTARIDSFVNIDRLSVEMIAKSVHPWLGRTADHNFRETMKFISSFSRTAERHPDGIERLVNRLPVLQRATRDELIQLCHNSSQRATNIQVSRQERQLPIGTTAR